MLLWGKQAGLSKCLSMYSNDKGQGEHKTQSSRAEYYGSSTCLWSKNISLESDDSW